jgi:hypothetical protein
MMLDSASTLGKLGHSFGRLAQLARAHPLQGWGQGFKSLNAHLPACFRASSRLPPSGTGSLSILALVHHNPRNSSHSASENHPHPCHRFPALYAESQRGVPWAMQWVVP